MHTRRLIGVVAILVFASCAEQAPSRNPAAVVEGKPYRPQIDPADFSTTIDNPYLPLVPGSRWVYRATTSDETEENVVEVTTRTKTVAMGVETVVVHDVVHVDGEVKEDTFDWFAQDRDGNVWYFGEATKAYEDGKADTGGSWEAGVDGAQPGIVMLASPKVGDYYRQEYYEGEAVDTGKVLELDASIKTPFGSFDNALVTEDVNPLEPDVVENKYYAKDVGFVYEEITKGGQETVELVEFESGKAS